MKILELTKRTLTQTGNCSDKYTLESYALLDGSVTFSAVALNKSIEAATENLDGYIHEQKAQVVIGQLPVVTGHHVQLTQLFQNLIQNGLKYNESVQPTVTIEQVDSITVAVSDNGIGVPEKHRSTIFEPLQRLWSADEYEGTGIGLATCKKIVTRHQGKFGVHRKRVRVVNSLFVCSLPEMISLQLKQLSTQVMKKVYWSEK